MASWWWPALLTVAVLGLVATFVDGVGRARARRRAPRRSGTRPATGAVPGADHAPSHRPPLPREIWWTRPARGGADDAEQPCLVLRVADGTATVLPILSETRPDRPGEIPLPAGAVAGGPGRPSFLATDDVRQVPVADFRRPAGAVGDALWARLRGLTGE